MDQSETQQKHKVTFGVEEDQRTSSELSANQGFDHDIEPHEKISTLRQQFYIWFLFFNHISAQWQTYLFVYLTSGKDPYTNIEIDLNMSNKQYGLVTGTVFTIVNSVFGLLMGYLADRYNRKWILFITSIAFTLMTLLCAYVHTFLQVLIPRIMFSFFMSACIPVSVSLINDYFEHEMRGRANSLFAFGIYLGGGLSSLTLILDEYIGWRHSIELVCVISLVWALPITLFHEPKRVEFLKSQVSIYVTARNSDAKSQEVVKLNDVQVASDDDNFHNHDIVAGYTELKKPYKIYTFREKLIPLLQIIFKNKCYVFFIIASTLRFFGGYSIGFWSPTFFEGNFPDYTKQYSALNAFVVIVGGLTSSYMGGYITDKYEHKYPQIKGQLSGFGALTSTIFIVITYTVQANFYLSIGSLFFAYLTAEMWYGPAHAAINRIFPSEFQGIAIAIFTLAGALAGAFATYLLGLLGDIYEIKQYPHRAGYMITAFVLFSYCTCCPMFLLAGREYEKEITQKNINKLRSQISIE